MSRPPEHASFEESLRIMPGFTDDYRHLPVFRARAFAGGVPRQRQSTVRVMDWPNGDIVEGGDNARSLLRDSDIQDLESGPEPALRVIFAPLDDDEDPETADLVLDLVKIFSIPPCFIGARLRGVTHEFGTRSLKGNQNAAYCHTLVKNINVLRGPDGVGEFIVDPRQELRAAIQLNQFEGTWRKEAFFLSWGPGRDRDAQATLVCFGAHRQLQKRFEMLGKNTAYEDCVKAPFTLFVIVLDELFQLLDEQVWNLLNVFTELERTILENAQSLSPYTDFDFAGLHNIAKHTTHLIESTNALTATAECIHQASLNPAGDIDLEASRHAAEEILYYKQLVVSVSLRLVSIEKRIQSMINLGFNVVAQKDSQILQKDSSSMKTIAAVTLIFLPLSTVSTVFGSQFFDFNPERSGAEFLVSEYFWILWAFAFAATVVIPLSWYLSRTRASQLLQAMKCFHLDHRKFISAD